MPGQDKKISQVVEEYLAYRSPRVSPTTWTQESYVLRRFVCDVRDVQIRHLTADHVGAWFFGPNGVASAHVTSDRRDRKPVQASTYNYYRRRLKGLFGFATQRGLIKVDLLQGVDEQHEHVRPRLQPPPEVLIAMLDHAQNPRDRAYLAVAVNTALRASEITSLRVTDIDLGSRVLHATIHKTREEDVMPITSDLDVELRPWLASYESSLGRTLRPTDHLFPARKGSVYSWVTDEQGEKSLGRTLPQWKPERPMTHTERVVQHALAAMGLPTLYEGTHTIRRAVARATFDHARDEVGYDAALRDVMSLLHHRSQLTTERYLGISADRLRRDERMRGKPFMSAMAANRAAKKSADGGPQESSWT